MMSVLEYANDVSKSVEEILKKCIELDIEARNEEDLLSEEDITILDSSLDQDVEEEIIDEVEVTAQIVQSKNMDKGAYKQKKKATTNSKVNKKELATKKKEMYKNKEKLMIHCM